MKTGIPIWLVIATDDPATVQATKRKIEELLKNPMLTAVLASNGVVAERVAVGEAVPTPQ